MRVRQPRSDLPLAEVRFRETVQEQDGRPVASHGDEVLGLADDTTPVFEPGQRHIS